MSNRKFLILGLLISALLAGAGRPEEVRVEERRQRGHVNGLHMEREEHAVTPSHHIRRGFTRNALCSEP